MKDSGALGCLLASSYFNRAVRMARSGEWVKADADLDRYLALAPADLRVALVRCKIRFRQGRLRECLTLLEEARSLGHDAEENDRMHSVVVCYDHETYGIRLARSAEREHRRAIVAAPAFFVAMMALLAVIIGILLLLSLGN